MNLEKAMRLPLVEGGIVKVIIGAILNIIPIVNFLCSGYFIEIMANAIREKHEMPAWENWGDKFVKGLLSFVISVAYMLIPIILLLGGGISTFFLVLAVLTGLVMWFVLPMALARYAATGSTASAFEFNAVLSFIKAVFGAYIGVYLFSLVLFIGLTILAAIPVIGWILSMLGGFYIGCVLAFLFGEAYRKAAAGSSGVFGA